MKNAQNQYKLLLSMFLLYLHASFSCSMRLNAISAIPTEQGEEGVKLDPPYMGLGGLGVCGVLGGEQQGIKLDSPARPARYPGKLSPAVGFNTSHLSCIVSGESPGRNKECFIFPKKADARNIQHLS